jgi:hypothetical protein
LKIIYYKSESRSRGEEGGLGEERRGNTRESGRDGCWQTLVEAVVTPPT